MEFTGELWAMEAWRAPADGLTPTGQCRRFIVDREELQRRDIDRLHRRWRDTASQLTKNGSDSRERSLRRFDDGKMAVPKADLKGGRLARGIIAEVDVSTHGTSVV